LGVTIHFEGQLSDETAYRNLIAGAEVFARERSWLTEPLESEETTLLRVRDEKEWDYRGPVKGMLIYPHEDCEPVRLEFDRTLYIQEYTKTQFAGAQIHVEVLELLTVIKPFFFTFKVEDEGEYWETGDLQLLSEHMDRVHNVIQEELEKNPSAQTKLKTPSGRIIDLMT